MAGAMLATGERADGRIATLRAAHPVLVQLVRYAAVGGLGTAVNAAIYLVARIWWEALPSNLLALVLSTAVSTEVNRRFTFGGAAVHHWRTHVQNGGTVLFYAFYSSAVLLALSAAIERPSPWQESLAVALASVLGGFGRFLLMRFWVFGPDQRTPAAAGTVHHMGRTTMKRTIAALLAATALVLTTAGSCGSGEDGNGVPGVSDQRDGGGDEGDGGDRNGGEDGNDGEDGDD